MAAKPSASPGPTHQENTSTSVLAGAAVATGAIVAVGRITGAAGACVAGTTGAGAAVVAAGPQAVRTSMAAISKLKTVKLNFLDNISFSLLF
jgi:proteasome assembly chaperone (PAC2) family protein